MSQTTAKQSNHEQRSDAWRAERLGKFTSSKASDLLGIKGLGETGKTYARKLAVDIVEGIDYDAQFVSYEMQHGIDTEPYAFEQFKQLKTLEFLEVSNSGFFELTKDIGGSPDGLVGNNAVLEIKCPNYDTFFKLVIDQKIDKKYYAQMQHQMWITEREKAYFFNYVIHNGEPKWHEIIVQRDEPTIDLLKIRTAEAIIIRDEYIEKLRKNRQY